MRLAHHCQPIIQSNADLHLSRLALSEATGGLPVGNGIQPAHLQIGDATPSLGPRSPVAPYQLGQAQSETDSMASPAHPDNEVAANEHCHVRDEDWMNRTKEWRDELSGYLAHLHSKSDEVRITPVCHEHLSLHCRKLPVRDADGTTLGGVMHRRGTRWWTSLSTMRRKCSSCSVLGRHNLML
jgi:hypothetical protein